MVREYLSTSDLAHAAHISVQQVRNYEADGLIPPAERSPSGYRRYTPRHLAALRTARSMIAGYGWPQARAIMQRAARGDLPAALAAIDECHADLAAKRLQLEQTLETLRTLAAQTLPGGPRLAGHARPTAPIRVGAAARQVGVRVSALRFWEEQGLLQPRRDQSSRYRIYDEQQQRRLRVVALLRAAGYDFPAIRATLDQLAAGRPAQAIAAVEKRRAELARTSWFALSAAAAFHAYVAEYCPELYQPLAGMAERGPTIADTL
jgi:DNA-binding transcriptional MerR regulator